MSRNPAKYPTAAKAAVGAPEKPFHHRGSGRRRRPWKRSPSTPSPQFPKRYEVRLYPDGSRAVVAWDLEALKVWYKRVLRG
jgi:hypothetical protein